MPFTSLFHFLFSIDMNNIDSVLLQDILKWRTNNDCLFKWRQCPKFILQQPNVNKGIFKMVGSCPSTGFGLTFCTNVLLYVLLYSEDIIPEELFPLYSAVTYWHLDSRVLISTTDFPLGVNINDSSKKKCCCVSALQSLYHRAILVNLLIMDKLPGCLMLPSSQKCRAFIIRMAPFSCLIPSEDGFSLPKLPHLWQLQAWPTTACGQLYQKVLKDAIHPIWIKLFVPMYVLCAYRDSWESGQRKSDRIKHCYL